MTDGFNQGYATAVYDELMSMDPDAAEMLAKLSTYETMQWDIEGNRRTIDRENEAVLKSMVADLSPIISKSDDDNSRITAMLLDVVSKAAQVNVQWKSKEHPRGKGGKFAKKGSQASMPITNGNARSFDPYANAQQRPQRGDWMDTTASMLNSASNEGGQFASDTSEFVRRWGDDQESAAGRVFSRLEAGGKVLGMVPNSHTQLAGAAAVFAGRYGPQAEEVVGTQMRKTAYRYRGTERKVDPKLKAQAEKSAEQLTRSDAGGFTPSGRPPTRNRFMKQGKWDSEGYNAALQNYQAGVKRERAEYDSAANDISPEMKSEGARLAAVGYLQSKLPSPQLAELHQKSGRIPPSEGVMINADGDITSQSVGYMEDHYVPFNLKNLKGMQGGQYVRTRSTGGPTSEDISTAVLAGARSLTVVSRSGVFTVDLDDDLRGGRRYSDKVGQMSRQYQNTLGAIAEGKVSDRKLGLLELAEIKSDVDNLMIGASDEDKNAEYKKRLDNHASAPKLTRDELADIKQEAIGDANETKGGESDGEGGRIPRDLDSRVKFFTQQRTEKAIEEKGATSLKLDGHGYGKAMSALREQFPYFIADTSYTPLPKSLPNSREREVDAGHVKRGSLRALGDSTKSKRMSAKGASSAGSGSTTEKEEAAPAGAKPKSFVPATAAERRTMADQQQKTGAKLHVAAKAHLGMFAEKDQAAQLSLSPELKKAVESENDAVSLSSDERKKLEGFMDENRDAIDKYTGPGADSKAALSRPLWKAAHQTMEDYRQEKGREGRGGVSFDSANPEKIIDKPFSFVGEEFAPGHTHDEYAANYSKYMKAAGGEEFSNTMGDKTDEQLANFSSVLGLRAKMHDLAAKGDDWDKNSYHDKVWKTLVNSGKDSDMSEDAAADTIRRIESIGSPEEHKKQSEAVLQARKNLEKARSVQAASLLAAPGDVKPAEPAKGTLRSLEASKTKELPMSKVEVISYLSGAAQTSTMSTQDTGYFDSAKSSVRSGDYAEALRQVDKVSNTTAKKFFTDVISDLEENEYSGRS